MELYKRLLEGDKRACARLISMLENDEEEAVKIIKTLYKHSGNAYVIGITGPPGGGKSTLTDRLTKELRRRGKKVGIIAIDPTSPFTGGSILGDRIRMQDLATDPGVFIRSMGTRGNLGGLSKATHGAAKILDIFGMDYIFVETVGVGQSEIDIVKTADTVLMVMVPGLGDDIQAIKAGIMEIGDIFAVNKSDLDGASKTALEIEMMLDFSEKKDWRPPVLNISASRNDGIKDLLDKIIEHKDYMISTGELNRRREKNTQLEILRLTEEKIMSMIINKTKENNIIKDISKKVTKRELDPYTARDMLIDIIN